MAQAAQSNTNPSNLWAAAMKAKIECQGKIDRIKKALSKARGELKASENNYEAQGIPAEEVRKRYAEKDMSEGERHALYAIEQISRRALNLWTAESPEDFETLMDRASQTAPADAEELAEVAGSTAYVDGLNGGMLGMHPTEDNRYPPGTLNHQRWALGCADGIGEKPKSADDPPREAPAMQASQPGNGHDPARAAQKKRGRPPRTLTPDTAATVAAAVAEDEGAGLFSDAPAMPEMPT